MNKHLLSGCCATVTFAKLTTLISVFTAAITWCLRHVTARYSLRQQSNMCKRRGKVSKIYHWRHATAVEGMQKLDFWDRPLLSQFAHVRLRSTAVMHTLRM